MIDLGHPFFFIEPLVRSGHVFTFSKYVYTPDSLSDEREIVEVDAAILSAEWVAGQMAGLRANQELALHSIVRHRGRVKHIPMIDFSIGHEFGEAAFARLRHYLPTRLLSSLGFFRTGRSFHAYGRVFLSPSEWLDFMGRLLLVNARNGEEIVDNRWIGHRLLSGYGSLRFSNNSGSYLSMPTEVGPRELVGAVRLIN